MLPPDVHAPSTPPSEPVRRTYLDVADRLRVLLLADGYQPGERIPTETALLPRLGVGRPLLREAVVALQNLGWLEVRGGSGMYLRDGGAAVDRATTERMPDLGPSPVEQFDSRIVVECELIQRAAAVITREEVDRLESLVDRMEANYPYDNHALGREFLLGIARASRLKLLPAVVEALLDMRENKMWSTLRERLLRPEHYQRTIADRRAMVAALRVGDGHTASDTMASMLQRMRAVYFETQLDDTARVPDAESAP